MMIEFISSMMYSEVDVRHRLDSWMCVVWG